MAESVKICHTRDVNDTLIQTIILIDSNCIRQCNSITDDNASIVFICT